MAEHPRSFADRGGRNNAPQAFHVVKNVTTFRSRPGRIGDRIFIGGSTSSGPVMLHGDLYTISHPNELRVIGKDMARRMLGGVDIPEDAR